jgi:hypothetical protein
MTWGTQSSKHAIQITVIYLIVSASWIFFSDRLLEIVVSDNQNLMQLQTYKGWLFVLVTSILLFYLISRSASSIIESRDKTEKALKEKQTLLAELHHRVKNNLALICSLIHLQVNSLDEAEATALLEIQYRIFTLAEIEELLYQNKDISRIPFHKFIKQFTLELEESETNNLSFQIQIDELYLNIDQAIPFGLLLNEIFTKLRMWEPKDQDQTVGIYLTGSSPNDVLLKLTFDGIPSSLFEPLKKEGYIEQTLMEQYSKQLDSSTKWLQEDGSIIYKLDFKKSDKQRVPFSV